MYEELEIGKTLIVGPKRVVESVWTKEVQKWEHLKHMKLSRVIGNPSQRKAALAEKADIYLISRDNIAWLIGLHGGSMLPFDMLIIDESSSFKNHSSVRFKALKKVVSAFARVVILTGTPAPNGLKDIWAQIYLLDQGERLSKFVTRFHKDYFNTDTWAGYERLSLINNKETGFKAEDAIYEKIGDICISMKAEDYLDLPDRVTNYIDIEFPPALRKRYQEFEEESVLQLFEEVDHEKDISAANAAALSNKLLQFANGAVYDDEKNIHEVHKLKLDAAEELVEAAQGEPILIAYTYKHDKERLLKRLKKYGAIALKTDKHVDDWNAGKIPVMIMHPASGGHGLNLQDGGNKILWYGLNWSLELYQQFNARVDRQGQVKPPIISHLVAIGTLDEKVIRTLSGKAAKQEGLMQAVKAKFRQYKKDR